MPGWYKDGDNWRYIQKDGYYKANSWYQDTDGNTITSIWELSWL